VSGPGQRRCRCESSMRICEFTLKLNAQTILQITCMKTHVIHLDSTSRSNIHFFSSGPKLPRLFYFIGRCDTMCVITWRSKDT
jgi:hypothetical protein